MRAKQHYGQDAERMKNMGVLLHGDGAFSGQVNGAVRPTLQHRAHSACCGDAQLGPAGCCDLNNCKGRPGRGSSGS